MTLLWCLAIIAALFIVPLLLGAIFNTSDRTEERRESERGEL